MIRNEVDTDKTLHILSLAVGGAMVVAALIEYVGHLWGHTSPWPWYIGMAWLGFGLLLLFPKRLENGLKLLAKYLLPWTKNDGG